MAEQLFSRVLLPVAGEDAALTGDRLFERIGDVEAVVAVHAKKSRWRDRPASVEHRPLYGT
ncbi:MAG: hypothetical protein QXG03_05210 [Halalkalicoccus sp.]